MGKISLEETGSQAVGQEVQEGELLDLWSHKADKSPVWPELRAYDGERWEVRLRWVETEFWGKFQYGNFWENHEF